MIGRRPARPGRLRLVLVGLLSLLAGCSSATPPTAPTASPIVVTSAGPGSAVRAPADWTGDTVELGDLPPEARTALGFVAKGGPFPFRQDGGIFGNREGMLPDRPTGTYREYTVITPGSGDRGARRLVVGDGRDVYYTDDHYQSFRFVVPDGG